MKKKYIITKLILLALTGFLFSQNFSIFDRDYICNPSSDYVYMFLDKQSRLTFTKFTDVITTYSFFIEKKMT